MATDGRFALCPQCQRTLAPGASGCVTCGYLFGDSSSDPGPKGIGGLLLLPLLGLIISPIATIYGLARDLSPILRADVEHVWAAFMDPASPMYGLAPIMILELLGNAVVIVIGLWTLAAFLRKSATTPRLFIIWAASFVVLTLGDLFLVSQFPAVADELDQNTFREVIRVIVVAAIWIPYFLKSKRVANTFVN